MKLSHIGVIVAVLAIGYILGIKFPSFGQSALSAVGV